MVDAVITACFGLDVISNFFTALQEGGRSGQVRARSTVPSRDSESTQQEHMMCACAASFLTPPMTHVLRYRPPPFALQLVTNRRAIAKAYVSGWFAVDVAATIPFDRTVLALIVASSDQGTLYLLGFLKVRKRHARSDYAHRACLLLMGGFLSHLTPHPPHLRNGATVAADSEASAPGEAVALPG